MVYFELIIRVDGKLPPWMLQEKCAGTVIGQEFYKLLLIDAITTLFARIITTVGLYFFNKKTRVEMDLVDGLLQMVYRQALLWAGLFFCPFIPLVAVISNAAYFYVNKNLVSSGVNIVRPGRQLNSEDRKNYYRP